MSTQLITFNKKKCIELIGGTAGIYLTYVAVGLLQEWLIKYPYKSSVTGQQENFTGAISLILFPHFMTYLIGSLYNVVSIKREEKTLIPAKNSIFCAFFVLLGGVTFNLAIKWTSYPIVATFKSCNLLSVILVGIFCSRVTDKRLKLSSRKIIIGIVASIGILLFKYYDPEVKSGDQKKFQWIGFALLFISLLADGFLPDFQAEIKSKYNPKPTEMMTQINKWVAIFCGIYVILSREGLQTVEFALNHELFIFHLIGLSLLTCMGHFIIYRMIKTFKQHIVPFVITTRKVFTVCISLVFYRHKTHVGQIFGIMIVLGVVIFQFYNELIVSKKMATQVHIEKSPEIEVETLTEKQAERQTSLYLQSK